MLKYCRKTPFLIVYSNTASASASASASAGASASASASAPASASASANAACSFHRNPVSHNPSVFHPQLHHMSGYAEELGQVI